MMKIKNIVIIISVSVLLLLSAILTPLFYTQENDIVTEETNSSALQENTSVEEITTEETTLEKENTTNTAEEISAEKTTTSDDIENTSKEISDTDDIVILINSSHMLPDDWEVKLIKIDNGQNADERAYKPLMQMLNDCKKAGYNPLVCSSYRSHARQTELYENKLNSYLKSGLSQTAAEEETSKWIARPGTSEHESGLAFDIVSKEYQVLDEKQDNTGCQKWLMKHCYEYGFILRYPKDKTDITEINYEPWHYRYVGISAANIMKNENLTLEEYNKLYVK